MMQCILTLTVFCYLYVPCCLLTGFVSLVDWFIISVCCCVSFIGLIVRLFSNSLKTLHSIDNENMYYGLTNRVYLQSPEVTLFGWRSNTPSINKQTLFFCIHILGTILICSICRCWWPVLLSFSIWRTACDVYFYFLGLMTTNILAWSNASIISTLAHTLFYI